jgi:Rrf2 family protein
MKLSRRGEYALRALIDLGIAQATGRRLLQAHKIVEKENIPEPFLEQILAQLREAGLIGTKRGKYGGYYLQKSADEISMGSIVGLIDGTLAPIGCVSQPKWSSVCPARARPATRPRKPLRWCWPSAMPRGRAARKG